MKKLIVANWKMQLTTKQAVKLAKQISALKTAVDLVICPSFTALKSVADLGRQNYSLGAQDVFWEEAGAYTGEVAPGDLKELGCRWVIVGHSERRQFLGETDEMVGRKVGAVWAAGLTPIICVGESEEERQRGEEKKVVEIQLRAALARAALTKPLAVAYEPVWAIGSGRTPQPAEIQAMHRLIAALLGELGLAKPRVIYGGSVSADNILDFLSLPEVAGALIGGASSDFKKFKDLIKSLEIRS